MTSAPSVPISVLDSALTGHHDILRPKANIALGLL